jgi:hypothetical protein
MKPHHAAALALVGWYLMLPPVTSDGRIQKDASLSRWYIISNFETKEECEKARLGTPCHPAPATVRA